MSRTTVDQLQIAPELAVLDVLDAALNAAIVALVAANLELQSPDDSDKNPPPPQSVRIADRMIERARTLGAEIYRYRLALVLEEERKYRDVTF